MIGPAVHTEQPNEDVRAIFVPALNQDFLQLQQHPHDSLALLRLLPPAALSLTTYISHHNIQLVISVL